MALQLRGLGLLFRRFQSGSSTVTHIPAYKPSTGSSIAAGNQVPANQKFFQIGDKLVHLRGSNDEVVYRGLLAVCLSGIGLTFFSIYRMAEGTMPKKARS